MLTGVFGTDLCLVLSNLNVVTEPQVVTVHGHRNFPTMATEIDRCDGWFYNIQILKWGVRLRWLLDVALENSLLVNFRIMLK